VTPNDDDAPRSESRRLDDPLLRVDEVTAGYGATTVLQGVSFDVGDGEVVGIVGRNGVGKTTTLRTIMGSLTPRAGEITYEGRSIADLEPEDTVRRGIALVPEERRIFGGLSVRENLELARLGGGDGTSEWDIKAVLDTFENLAARETAAGSTLSGGEQQMLAIGRALVSNARTLLLDEPTEGLAPYVVEQVVETIEALQEQGLTILLVEQNVRMALDVCDYIYVMDNGRIVHESSSDALRDDNAVLDRYLSVSLDGSAED
jgi:branched-chain amino acid transport system ATP-binding protein